MTVKPLFTSSNGVWEILGVMEDADLSIVEVKNNSTLKTKFVYVEHIKIGDEFIVGGTAEANEDHVLEKGLPKYLESKIIELTTQN